MSRARMNQRSSPATRRFRFQKPGFLEKPGFFIASRRFPRRTWSSDSNLWDVVLALIHFTKNFFEFRSIYRLVKSCYSCCAIFLPGRDTVLCFRDTVFLFRDTPTLGSVSSWVIHPLRAVSVSAFDGSAGKISQIFLLFIIISLIKVLIRVK